MLDMNSSTQIKKTSELDILTSTELTDISVMCICSNDTDDNTL